VTSSNVVTLKKQPKSTKESMDGITLEMQLTITKKKMQIVKNSKKLMEN